MKVAVARHGGSAAAYPQRAEAGPDAPASAQLHQFRNAFFIAKHDGILIKGASQAACIVAPYAQHQKTGLRRPWARYMLATSGKAAPALAGNRLGKAPLTFGVFAVRQQAAAGVARSNEGTGGHTRLPVQQKQGRAGQADSQDEGPRRLDPVFGLPIGRK